MSRKITLQLGGNKPPLGPMQSKLSSDSTNSKSQSDPAPRGQRRPASGSDNDNSAQVSKVSRMAEPASTSQQAARDIEAKSSTAKPQTREKKLEADILRLQQECRAANEEKARLETYLWAREAITEEEKRLREIIKERDETIQSRDSHVSKLKAELKKKQATIAFTCAQRDAAKDQLRNMTAAYNAEKAAREQLETKMTRINERRAIGCSLARDVRFWCKNRQAERFAQAGKYEQDAVKAAKDFNCGDSSCTSCPKG